MKVLFAYRYGILGGVCTQIINRLSAGGSGQSIESHLLFSSDFGIGKTLRDFPHLHFENRPARIRDLARFHGFDVAVVIDTPEIVEALAPVVELPIVTEVHTTLPNNLQYLRNRSWTTSGFIVPSEYLRRRLVREFGIGRFEPVEICPNSINPDIFPLVDLENPPDRPVVCWVGKLDGHKNWRGFLRVAAKIIARKPETDFWMIGGSTAPAAEESAFLREISDLGLGDRVRWLPRIEYAAMHRVYAAVRMSGGVKLVTSVDESFGMSVLEALICGCAVVAPTVGGLSEISEEKPTFRFYSPGDSRQAAKQTLEILDLEDADEIALAGRELLIQRFGTGTVVSQYFDALRALVDGTSPSIPNKDRLLGAVDRLAEKLPRHDERAAGAVDTLDAASKVIADPPVRMYLKLRRLLSPSWPHRNLRSDSSSKDE